MVRSTYVVLHIVHSKYSQTTVVILTLGVDKTGVDGWWCRPKLYIILSLPAVVYWFLDLLKNDCDITGLVECNGEESLESNNGGVVLVANGWFCAHSYVTKQD